MTHHDIRMTAKKIARRLILIEPLAHRSKVVLAPFTLHLLPDPVSFPSVNAEIDPAGEIILPNTYWGETNLNFLMKGVFQVPAEMPQPIALYLPIGEAGDFSHPEALVYIDGEPYATVDRHHQEFNVPPQYCDGQTHQLMLHGWTGILGGLMPSPGKKILMHECAVVGIDTPTRELIALTRTALEAANLLDDLEPAKTRLYNALDRAFILLDTSEPLGMDAFYASVPHALEALWEGIAGAGVPLDAEIIAAGHAHIDVAWLWTLAQTRRKAGRTFYTVMRLMEQFPDYHFTQSQPQLYAYVQEYYPKLFAAIQARIEEGRWEPIGGMWVEADCNLSGAEALARQFLLGRTYFREQFGAEAESPVLWLPDVFGYAWNLPQLIKLAGLEYFFTIKIGWNQVNKMPYDSFWWQGLDGTKVLTHFSTTPEVPRLNETPDLYKSATYNANLSAFTALGSWAKLKHKEAQKIMLMSYGYGDGGGGPTREMNENAQILREFPALPRVRQGKVIDFFRRLESESGTQLPTWNSELYLEIHRGTYTTQSRNKRANRQSEFLLHDAEFFATLAQTLDPSYLYPHEVFRKAWQLLCLNQFHDIIPGSSINQVYVDSQAQYAELRTMVEAVQKEALAIIARHVGGEALAINPSPFTAQPLLFWAGELPGSPHVYERPLNVQPVGGGFLLELDTVLGYGVIPLTFADADLTLPTTDLIAAPNLLENRFLRVELNTDGDIIRIFDKQTQREVLPPGTIANQWQAFEDRPLFWDAWDVDIFYDDKQFLAEPATSIQVVESGGLRATLEIRRRILHSEYTQRISLQYNRAQLDFETWMDWHERHILLKTAFPVDVLSPQATFEVQWGNVQRPTHRNTSWDWARFETCAHKWVDLSERDFGVALLNDCKYGHDIQGNVIRLSLLRSPTMPDPEADQGDHQFRYSLLVHSDVTPQEIARHAYLLNDPTRLYPSSGNTPQERQLISVVGSAILETVKQAEDGEGVVVRLYEPNRQRGWVTLYPQFTVTHATLTNLLEEPLEKLVVEEGSVRFYIKPFQIVTVRLV